jgi:hypothetical protein
MTLNLCTVVVVHFHAKLPGQSLLECDKIFFLNALNGGVLMSCPTRS